MNTAEEIGEKRMREVGDQPDPRGGRPRGGGEWPVDDNPLRGAPHTAACLVDKWDHPYPRELAAYPM
jgi:hypothetical protein